MPGPAVGLGHNGGPPLDDEPKPPWGDGSMENYFHWKAAHEAAWRNVPRDIALLRLKKAELLGLTYREYTLEILNRGRYLQVEDTERIAEIKRMRERSREGP